MRRETILGSCVALLVFGSLAAAAEPPRAFIGVSLDMTALPPLLTKHLRLDPGQGVRINNIMIGSPAEQVGLERDDIIVVFQGQKITDRKQVIDAVHQAGIGATVSLEVIHLGQHQTVSLKLDVVPDPQTAQWKYPPEPEVVTSWRPSKVYKVRPDGQGFVEIPDGDMKSFFKESYTYQHTTGGDNYTITIEGDPADKDSRLTVQAGDQTHGATVGTIDSLPDKYRASARQSVEDARANKVDVHIQRGTPAPDVLPPDAQRFFENLPRLDLNRVADQKDAALEKLQGQMEQLQQQMKDLEQRNRELVDKLLQKQEPSKGTASPAETKPKPAV